MEPQIHETTNDARAGETRHIVRYVLAISLLLVIVAFIAIYLWGGGATGEESHTISTVTPSEQAQP